jgi:hypothetical protein
MKIKVDDELANKIFQNILMMDYQILKADIKSDWIHPEDQKTFKKYKKAIETLGDWYFTDFQAAVKDFLKGE